MYSRRPVSTGESGGDLAHVAPSVHFGNFSKVIANLIQYMQVLTLSSRHARALVCRRPCCKSLKACVTFRSDQHVLGRSSLIKSFTHPGTSWGRTIGTRTPQTWNGKPPSTSANSHRWRTLARSKNAKCDELGKHFIISAPVFASNADAGGVQLHCVGL